LNVLPNAEVWHQRLQPVLLLTPMIALKHTSNRALVVCRSATITCGNQLRRIEEMHKFLGVTLKASLASIDGGGDVACFMAENKTLRAETG